MYNWKGINKIPYEEAIARLSNNLHVYLLFDDDTESMADSEEDINKHNSFYGEFGYEKEC
jgi:hypothetical protein